MTIKAVLLPRQRWYLEKDGVKGPIVSTEEPAFWPTKESPDIVALHYYLSEIAFVVHQVIPEDEVEWVDQTSPDEAI